MTKKQKDGEIAEREPKVILGLDVSTATIGISLVLNDNGKITPVDVKHLRLNTPSKITGTKALLMKTEMFINKIAEYNEKYVIDKIIIEEPLMLSNNAVTASALMKFNGMITWCVYNTFGITPEYISSYDARKYGMPELMAVRKYDKRGNMLPYKKIRNAINKNELVLFGDYTFDVAKKDVIWNYISETFPTIEWVFDKNGELKKENFDASDSLICILGYLNKRKYENSEMEVVSYDEKEEDGCKKIVYDVLFCGKTISHSVYQMLPKNIIEDDEDHFCDIEVFRDGKYL